MASQRMSPPPEGAMAHGVPTASGGPGNSSKGSSSSFRSMMSKLNRSATETRLRICTLHSTLCDKLAELEDQVDKLIDEMDKEQDPAKQEQLHNAITKLKAREEKVKQRFERQIKAQQDLLQAEQDLMRINEDDEQRLDSDDEREVRRFDERQQEELQQQRNMEISRPSSVDSYHSVSLDQFAITPRQPVERDAFVTERQPRQIGLAEPPTNPNAREFIPRSHGMPPPREYGYKPSPESPPRSDSYGGRPQSPVYSERDARQPQGPRNGQVYGGRARSPHDTRDYGGHARSHYAHDCERRARSPHRAATYPGGNFVQDFTSALKQAFGKPQGSFAEKRLPDFNGDPGQWGNFYATFWRTTRSFEIQDSENMARLEQALKGDAKIAVQHLMVNVGNINAIMEILEEKYGRPEFILDYLILKVKECKPPELSKPRTVVDFGTAVQSLATSIQTYDRPEYYYNTQLVMEFVEKLPLSMRNSWYSWLVENPSRRAYLSFFADWMTLQTKVAQLQVKPAVFSTKEKSEEKSEKRKKERGLHAATKDSGKSACLFCDMTNHSLKKCYKFLKAPFKERKSFVQEKQLCFRCLGKSHRATDCEKPVKCDVNACARPDSHHPILHMDIGKGKPPKKDDLELEQNEVSKVLNTASGRSRLPIIPVTVRGPNGKMKIHALLDTGADFCMMEKCVADKLGLQGPKEPLEFVVFNGRRSEKDSMKVNVEISGDFNRAPFYPVTNIHTVDRMDLPSKTFDVEVMKRRYPHLEKMKARSVVNARPQLLLGINCGGLFAAREILEPSPGEAPAAVRSLIGWYVIEDEETVGKHLQCMVLDQQMHQDIQDFVAIENLGIKELPSGRSQEDARALNILEENTRKENGKWSTRLLWRDKSRKLPPSRDMAVKRLESMERKMERHPEFQKLCHEKFEDYIASGFLRKVDPGEKVDESKKWHLPWFFAFHPDKNPRLVLDAAAKSCGKSLNDFLFTGPDLLNPLYAVLLRFRRHQIAVNADIKSMFHQVGLSKEDWPSQTILYRKSKDCPIEEFQMTVLIFGAASSPSSACFARDQNARMFEKEHPVAVHAIMHDFYMDDFLSGADTKEEAIKLCGEVNAIHDAGGFPLVKWNCSDLEVLQTIAAEFRAKGDKKLQAADEDWEKTLGLLWNPDSDEFAFKLSSARIPENIILGEKVPTKRIVTSVVMSIFDPLGFLCIIKLQGLLLIQKIWKSGIKWDDPIGDRIFEEWRSWLEEIKEISNIRIPRKLSESSLKTAKDIALHVFCDASETAYACSAYLRIDTGGSVTTPFVMGKVRIGPIKGLTIPRMELNAALIGARLAKSILDAYKDDIKISSVTYWTDSATVLHWIRATDKRFKMYVANRIGEIQELSNVNDWRWVPSKENVADDATKIKNSPLTADSRWYVGPAFLRGAAKDWPKQEKLDETNDEEEKILMACHRNDKDETRLPKLEDYSCWFRLMRATASRYSAKRRFLNMLEKNRNSQLSETITLDDMKDAEVLWIKEHQEKFFPQEYDDLTREGVVSRKSSILSLSPGLNKDGIIVMKGRLENADVDDSVKFPVILDPKDDYVKKLIAWYHKSSQHYGQERVINELRKSYWILGVRAAVKKSKSECLVCNSEPQSQKRLRWDNCLNQD